ncbi:hypothetical protein FY528_08580 [Hymenobacter lutimineralis]|uniref:Uncharacterized protein n=1 Tax=Hymenobacter lutimineralis TaxID=2606448 RepID=A0A5D6V5Q1_9BACT|nr:MULTISPECIES: DUF6686 family protein [Hymenobacter]QIX63025.1 hypothetical protein HER32_18330 [Hymenobacter sp. BT18]TYZ10515.1 hypothetical protein FY528_08580 [Hymenobacter lutimineralis]
MAQFFHHNEFGYCARCPRTQHLHVCFGNVALATTAAEFAEFRAYVARTWQHHCLHTQDPEVRCIALRTPVCRMALVFSLVELTQLQEILENTALLLEVEELLR